jgi:hypothetical protein
MSSFDYLVSISNVSKSTSFIYSLFNYKCSDLSTNLYETNELSSWFTLSANGTNIVVGKPHPKHLVVTNTTAHSKISLVSSPALKFSGCEVITLKIYCQSDSNFYLLSLRFNLSSGSSARSITISDQKLV